MVDAVQEGYIAGLSLVRIRLLALGGVIERKADNILFDTYTNMVYLDHWAIRLLGHASTWCIWLVAQLDYVHVRPSARFYSTSLTDCQSLN